MADESVPLSPDSLTRGEQRLVDAIHRGRRARCRGEVVRASVLRTIVMAGAPDGEAPPSGVAVDGAIIDGTLDLEGCAIDWPVLFFDCQFGKPGDDLAPLVIRDARLRRLGLHECVIHGGIKAERVSIESSLFMGKAQIDGPLRLRGARIGGSLNLEESVLREPGNALSLDSAEVRGNWLMREARVEGTVRFLGATLGGSLLMESATIRSPGLAMAADSADIQGAWILNRATIAGYVRLRSAKLRAFVATDTRFIEPVDPATLTRPHPPDDAERATETQATTAPLVETPPEAETRELVPSWARDARDRLELEIVLNLNGVRIDGDLALRRSTVVGGLSLRQGLVEGVVSLERANIEGPPPAVDATGVNACQGIALDHAVIKGGLTIEGARVSRDVAATNLTVKTLKGRAITADVVRVEGNWIMRGAKLTGTVRMSGAQVDGQLAMADCRVKGRELAIRADGVQIGGGWFMSRAKIDGLVRFPASTIGNQLRFSGAHIQVDRGPAIFANGITVKRDAVLADGFTTNGGIALDQTRIHGTLNLRGSTVRSATMKRGDPERPDEERGEQLVTRYDTLAVSLVDSSVDRIQLPGKPDHRPVGIVDLSRARTGSLDDHADAWPPHGPDVDDTWDHLVLDGFTYDHLENPAGVDRRDVPVWTQRLIWLEGQAQRDLDEFFKPAPWLQLADRLRAQGYQEDARQIAIQRERRQRRSSSVRQRVRWQSRLLDWFALYGHNPWRTVGWIVVFVLLFAGVWTGAAQQCGKTDCSDETVFVRTKRGEFADDLTVLDATYPEFNALAYSFDLFVPVVDFGHREFWRPNTRFRPLVEVAVPKAVLSSEKLVLTVGELLYVLTIVEMVLGLILTSLAVTGFTGLIASEV